MKLKAKWRYLACDRTGFYLCTRKPIWDTENQEWFSHTYFVTAPECFFHLPKRKIAVWRIKDMKVAAVGP